MGLTMWIVSKIDVTTLVGLYVSSYCTSWDTTVALRMRWNRASIFLCSSRSCFVARIIGLDGWKVSHIVTVPISAHAAYVQPGDFSIGYSKYGWILSDSYSFPRSRERDPD